MYPVNIGVKDMCSILGLGRNKVLYLCQTKLHNFPVVKVGSRYQADEAKLLKWRQDWYEGKFQI